MASAGKSLRLMVDHWLAPMLGSASQSLNSGTSDLSTNDTYALRR